MLSSTRFDYIVTKHTTKEYLWINTIIEEIDIFELKEIKIFCDNQSTRKLATNPKITDENKDNRARVPFIRDLVEEKETITMWLISSLNWCPNTTIGYVLPR